MTKQQNAAAEKNKATLAELGKTPELAGIASLAPIYSVEGKDNLLAEDIIKEACKLAETTPEAWNALPENDRAIFINEVIEKNGATVYVEGAKPDPDADKKSLDDQEEKKAAPEEVIPPAGPKEKSPGSQVAVIEPTAETSIYTLEDVAGDFLSEAQRFLDRVAQENTTESAKLHEAARLTGSAVFELKRTLNLN